MGWTKWRPLMTPSSFEEPEVEWNQPGCYELALAGPRGGRREIVYVGRSVDLASRLQEHGHFGSHLADDLDAALRDRRWIWYRVWRHDSEQEAIAFEGRLLDRFDYPWNIQHNS